MQQFYRINSNLPIKNQIKLLNDMVLALHGMVAQGKFDLNELTKLYDSLGSGYSMSYARNVVLDTIASWEHIHAESGYSIWKYAPDNYDYDAANQVYFNERVLENRGEALNETATQFDKVFLYTGTFADITAAVSTDDDNYHELLSDTDEYIYIGNATKFNGFKLEFETRASNYTNVYEYWNGSAWVNLDESGLTFDDTTSSFISDGLVLFDAPLDWAASTVNSEELYWVRVSTSTPPVTVAEARVIIPADSVVALLAMSSTELLNEEFAFCSYNDAIYVVIKNAGAPQYEGADFITSSSSTTNKENFFKYNNEFKADYLLT